MNVKKFTATSSREALRKVREALGSDAVILSNRTVNGEIEILALASEDMSALAEPSIENSGLSQSTLAALAPSLIQKRKSEDDQASNLAEALGVARNASMANHANNAGEPGTQELSSVMNE